MDKETGLPILSSLLTSLTGWSTKFIALKLRALGKIPKVIITDGLSAYQKMFSCVIHQICIFHHQQGVLRFLSKRFQTEEELKKPKKEMKKVFQTNDKRTVKRRLEKLSIKAHTLGITDWVTQTKWRERWHYRV